jgi:hypothetical protein
MTGEEVTIGEIGRIVMRLEHKLDRAMDDLEARVRYLERAVWVATGLGGAALASAIGALVQALRL